MVGATVSERVPRALSRGFALTGLTAMGGGAAVTSQNPYTEELRVTTYFRGMSSEGTASWLEHLPGLICQGKWDDAFRGYRRMLDGLDLWVADQLRKKGKGNPRRRSATRSDTAPCSAPTRVDRGQARDEAASEVTAEGLRTYTRERPLPAGDLRGLTEHRGDYPPSGSLASRVSVRASSQL